MGRIIAIGEKKKIRGDWYQKETAPGEYCTGCAFENKCPLPNLMPDTDKAIEDGGSECRGTIWTRTTAPKGKKPKAPKPVWSTKFLSINPKSTKADLVKLLQETVDQLNETGTKLVAAQNTITRLKKKVSK